MTVKEIMTSQPIMLHPEDNLTKAIERMKDNHIHHLPIVDDYSNVVGMISQSDLYQKALSLSKHTSGISYTSKVLFNTPVSQIMTEGPTTVSSDDDVSTAIEIITNSNFHALPVVLEEQVVGIVTAKDLLEAMQEEVG